MQSAAAYHPVRGVAGRGSRHHAGVESRGDQLNRLAGRPSPHARGAQRALEKCGRTLQIAQSVASGSGGPQAPGDLWPSVSVQGGTNTGAPHVSEADRLEQAWGHPESPGSPAAAGSSAPGGPAHAAAGAAQPAQGGPAEGAPPLTGGYPQGGGGGGWYYLPQPPQPQQPQQFAASYHGYQGQMMAPPMPYGYMIPPPVASYLGQQAPMMYPPMFYHQGGYAPAGYPGSMPGYPGSMPGYPGSVAVPPAAGAGEMAGVAMPLTPQTPSPYPGVPSLESLAQTLATASLAVQAYAALAGAAASTTPMSVAGAPAAVPASSVAPTPTPTASSGAAAAQKLLQQQKQLQKQQEEQAAAAAAAQAPVEEEVVEEEVEEVVVVEDPPTAVAGADGLVDLDAAMDLDVLEGGGEKPLRDAKVGVSLMRCDGVSCSRESIVDGNFTHAQPSTTQLMLMWGEAPRSVLLLKKLGPLLLPQVVEVMRMLKANGVTSVFVEEVVVEEVKGYLDADDFSALPIRAFHREPVDFVVCLGGDGVILHASSIYQANCPPIIGFNLGSMGFLAPHSYLGVDGVLTSCVSGTGTAYDSYEEEGQVAYPGQSAFMQPSASGLPVTLRMRLRCDVLRAGETEPSESFEVLNELCMDRGPSSFLSMIECLEVPLSGEPRLLTKVQADGVLVATPTGSTAYSVSAGGSMMHPSVPAILVTPICPHSLSFRPVILPDSAVLQLRVPTDARSTAWVCFDGKSRQELNRGDSVRIRMSEFPVPTVNWGDEMHEFVGSLERCLRWNDREEQKPFSEGQNPLGA